ncbi:MAG TPA: AAA family ATPase [Actinomycetota bacterium]
METQRAQPAPRTPGRLFVGRQQEMAELSALLDDAVAGRGGLALLVGEPGIGKTRTAEEFAGLARDRGVTVRWGSAFEGQGTPAYWPWVEILREEASGSGAAGAEPGEEGPSADSLAQLLQEAGERVEAPSSLSALPPERARFRLFDGVSSLLRAASRRAPLLIVIDDLHWADEPSLLLLEFVVREIQSSPVLVVGTYRAEELGRQHPLSPVLGRLTMARRLALRGFSGDEVAELIEASAGSIPSAALVETVHQMTEGNPFFVAEVVRLLAANRLEPGGDGTWSVAVPQGVREVIGRRLGGLSEDCNAILRVASVIGRDFGAKLLARVAEVEPDELLSLLEEAGAGGLVEEVPGAIGHHRFSHALVRETLYAELTTIQRVRYHRRVAETLEELYGPASPVHLNELAHHYLEAAPSGDLHAAVAYARMAAERAVELLAYEEAVRLYESALQALELLGGGDDMRSQMLLGLGDAMWRSGDEAGASTAFREAVEAARRAGDPELLGRAALGPGSVVVMLGLEVGIPNEPQIALLEEALAALDGMESDLRSRILARLAAHLYWSAGTQSRRSELAAEAVELARRLDDPDALAYALSARHWATWTPDNLEERMTTADEVIRLASRRGNRLLEGLGRVYRVMDLLEAGRMVEAGREAALVGRIGDELRDPTTQWFAALCLGMDAILEGRFTDGERLAEDALRLGRGAMTGDSTWATMGYAMQVFCIGLHRGVIDQVEGAVRGMVHAIPNLPALQCTLAQASALMGREAQARTDFEAVARDGFAGVPRDVTWLSALVDAAHACHLLDDRDRAGVLYGMLLPFADRHVVIGPAAAVLGPVSLFLGVLATTLERWEDAEVHFVHAEEEDRRTGNRPFEAHALLYHGQMLLRRGDPADRTRAEELVREALDIGREVGMRKTVDDAEGLLGAAPGSAAVGPDRSPVPSGMFRREGEFWTVGLGGTVARLKDAKGLRYIAHLLIRPGVEVHVMDLVTAASGAGGGARTTVSVAQDGLTAARPGDAGEVLDARAREAYRARLEDLRSELEEAEENNDPERAGKARWEIDAIADQLSSAVGLGGRSRRAASPAERARVNVRNAISASLKVIRKHDEPLWRHLSNAIRTGTFCSYEPERPVDWSL